MRARKTILTAVTAGAFLLPLAIAVPASADPSPGPRPLCENHVNCDAGNRDAIRVNVGIGHGGDCEQDKLLLVRVRIDAGHSHRSVQDAQRAYDTAIGEYNAAKTADAKEDAVIPPATTAGPDPVNGDAADKDLAAATIKRDTARRHLDEARESGRLLDAKIALLTDRINGTECATPTPTPTPLPVPVPAPVDTPAPVTDTPAPPTVINNGPIVVTPSNPQVGVVPSGPAPTGGGALRDQIS